MRTDDHPTRRADLAVGTLERAPQERVNWVDLDPVLPRPRPLPAGDLHRRHPHRRRAVRGPLLRADVLHHRRLPPLLRPRATSSAGSCSSCWPSAAPTAAAEGRRSGGPPTTGDHHRYSDTERDIHSPRKGFWWSHVGWILCDKLQARPTYDGIKDFARYPELRWLEQARLGRAVDASAVVCFLHRRLERARGRVLLVDRAAVARAPSP